MPAPDDRPVIQLDGVGLRYRLATQRVGSIKEYFIHMARGALQYKDLWALEAIDLQVKAGEAVGIMGRNGAGKSTLAKVIAGVLKPSRGRCRVNGWVSPILELGTGFDPELTGHENIFLNALLLGRRKREIEEKVDEIVAFSGIERFIHTPMRNYSTGMLARLGFAIATAWTPEVLILDEVLAVGDAHFLVRCHERVDAFRKAGVTIVLVSHSPDTLLAYSTRCLWLEEGKVIADGAPRDILDRYATFMEAPDSQGERAEAGGVVQPPAEGEGASGA